MGWPEPSFVLVSVAMPFLRTLGLPELLRDDGTPVGGLRLKDLALLAYLCVEGERAHPRARLAALLWSESTEDRALHSFTQALGRIQRVLGRSALDVKRESIRWMGCIASDAGALLADNPWHPSLDDRLTIYRSDFLDGFEPGEGGEDFNLWADRTRARLRNLALRALERRGEDAEARSEWERALRIGERAVQIDPLWESGHRRAMRALAERGEQNRALRHYETFRDWLAEEVGGEPDPETRRLAQLLRNGRACDAAPETPDREREGGKTDSQAEFERWSQRNETVFVLVVVLPALLVAILLTSLVPLPSYARDDPERLHVPFPERVWIWVDEEAHVRTPQPPLPSPADTTDQRAVIGSGT